MAEMSAPRCPRCGKKTATPSAENNHAFYCHHCKQVFEAIDDGTIGYGDPARIVERDERQRLQRQRDRQTRRPAPRQLRGGLGR